MDAEQLQSSRPRRPAPRYVPSMMFQLGGDVSPLPPSHICANNDPQVAGRAGDTRARQGTFSVKGITKIIKTSRQKRQHDALAMLPAAKSPTAHEGNKMGNVAPKMCKNKC